MKLHAFLLALAALSVLAVDAAARDPAVVTTPQVRAELLAHAPEGLQSGKPVWLGLRIEHAPHWHTYWKNPGDSGLPTTFEWKLPAGLEAGAIEWPTPQRYAIGPLMNYGYENQLLLPVPVTVTDAPLGDTVTVQLRADWLVCKEVCIPEGGDFTLRLPVRAATASNAALFAAALQAVPKPLPGVQASARATAAALSLRVSGMPAAWQGKELAFFPETEGLIQNAARVTGRWSGDTWQADIPLDPQRSEGPATIPAVLTAPGQAAGARITVEVNGAWPSPGSTPAAAKDHDLPGAAPAADGAGASVGLGLALLFALLGGALLNLMPCVFPVLSLKVLGFAAHAGDRKALLGGGLAYTAGVVLSFLALAGLLLALRAGGEQLGWGFQLQSPAIVAALAALFTLIGLNLAGVFEFGSVLPSSLAAARARHPMVDSLLTGVLAVAVASPCTAPFMGASLGLALTLPATQALAVFATLGLGMALPYLAASAWPALARALPRPGAWMAHFKTVMAFPMFATVIWLVWVLGQQVGIDGVAALLGLLLALAFVAWALGSPTLGKQARGGFGIVSVLLLVAALFWSAPTLKQDAIASQAASAADDGWQPWSEQAVRQGQAEGRMVFVDFTAAWCVTCQYNKRTILAAPEVQADFAARNVLLLRADWTRRDPAITAALASFGRSGVPVYALYAPAQPRPRLLSEILTVDEVRGALAGPAL